MEMTCSNPECGGAVLVGDRFCGLCGTPAPEASRLAPWPGPAGAAPAPSVDEPMFSHEPRRAPGPRSSATRFLCTAAYLNRTFANRVIGELLATRRAVAPSINFDVGPVLRHCLRARRTILLRDLTLLAIIVIGLVIKTLTTLDFLLFALTLGVLLPGLRRRRGGPIGALMFAAGTAAGLIVSFVVLSAVAFGSFASSLPTTGPLSPPAPSFTSFAFPFVLLLAATWATEFVYLHTTFRTLAEDLRGGSAAPRAVSGAAEARIAMVEGAQWGNVTLHSRWFPFIGAGVQTDMHWSIAIRLRPRDPVRQQFGRLPGDDGPVADDALVQIDPVDLHRHIRLRLQGLNDPRLPENERITGLTVSDRVVGSGLLSVDNLLFDKNLKAPYSHASREAVEALMRHPQARLRYYQQVSVSDEGPDVMSRGRRVIESVDQEVAVSAFVYAAVEGGMFYLQFVLTALPPIDQKYRLIAFGIGTSTLEAVWYSISRLFASIASAPSGISGAFRLWRTERRVEREYLTAEGGDFGTQISVRQLATAPWFGSYIEELDVEKYNMMFSRLLLETVTEYLGDKGVDTSAFESSAQTIVNNGDLNYFRGDNNKIDQMGGRNNTHNSRAAGSPPQAQRTTP
jgi:hypothetical protein